MLAKKSDQKKFWRFYVKLWNNMTYVCVSVFVGTFLLSYYNIRIKPPTTHTHTHTRADVDSPAKGGKDTSQIVSKNATNGVVKKRIEGRWPRDKTRHVFYCYCACTYEIFMFHHKLWLKHLFGEWCITQTRTQQLIGNISLLIINRKIPIIYRKTF